jgi:iron complex outermembrane receptor protein
MQISLKKLRGHLLAHAGSIAIVVAATTSVAAQQKIAVDIPTQPLEEALKEFGIDTNSQVMFSQDSVTGRSSSAVKGQYDPSEALRLLLRGTNLRIEKEGNVFLVKSPNGTEVRANRIKIAATAEMAIQTAQAAPPSPPAQPVDEIVVTGTHIVRDGYEAPSPLTVMSADQIDDGAREDLAKYIALMPSALAGYSPQAVSSTTNTGATGVNSVNLRSMGTVRTLVLLDGRRSVGASTDGTIDVSEFPQELISRIDVVTGGASAAYGSDAIAGVVNFILDKNFTGVKGSLEGGVTTYGDNRNWKVTLTAGTKFANDRGQFMISGSAAARDGLLNMARDRDWTRQGWKLFQNPSYNATNGQPQYLFLPQSGVWAMSEGGIITNTALKGTEFGPGGTPFQYNFGPIVAGTVSQGGDWKTRVPLLVGSIDPSSQRQSLFTYASYDVSDNFQVFAEVSWAYSGAQLRNASQNINNLAIKADNAFIPASVRARMSALNLASINVSRSYSDLADLGGETQGRAYNSRTLNRYTIGANGNFDAFNTNWKWDIYGHSGATRASSTYFSALHNARNALAIDAVVSPTTGAIVCRSTLTNPTNGCVPYNVFGVGVNSQAAVNYVSASPHANLRITQKNVAWTVSGEPLDLWAGPVSLAAGFEWRKDAISGSANDISLAFAANTSNYQATFGRQSVAEGFLETVIPLAKDQSWAKSLDLNAAVRFTEYSLSGFGTSYKFGATYQPVDDLRFRASRSHDFRAPTLGELFATGADFAGNLNDPFNNNVVTTISNRPTGNPNLMPEKSDTTQVGVVFQPAFLPGFNASADYWNIKVSNSIATPTAAQILGKCFEGSQIFCNAFARQPGLLIFKLSPFNLASQRRNGLDLEAGYKFAMADIVDSWGGNLELRVLATRHFKAIVDSGITGTLPVSYVGTLYNAGGGATGVPTGSPKWVYTTTLTYDYDPIRLTLTGHGFSGGTMDNIYIECTSGCPTSTANTPTINRNYMPGFFYFDASVSYKVNDTSTLFFSVQNIANLDPPPYTNIVNANSPTIPPMNGLYYDVIGRAFRAGVRFRM